MDGEVQGLAAPPRPPGCWLPSRLITCHANTSLKLPLVQHRRVQECILSKFQTREAWQCRVGGPRKRGVGGRHRAAQGEEERR